MHPLPGKLSQRNEADTFLGASAVAMEGVLDLETAEALACREVLALANDLMLRKVRIATDCGCGEEYAWPWDEPLWPHHQGDQGRNGKLHVSGCRL